MNTRIMQQYLSLNVLKNITNEIMNPLQRLWNHWDNNAYEKDAITASTHTPKKKFAKGKNLGS